MTHSVGSAAVADDTEPQRGRPVEGDTLAVEDRESSWLRLLALVTPMSWRSRALQEQLAAEPPSLIDNADRTAAIPRRLPAIPGVIDLEPWARGGMGVVYRGRDEALDRPVAVKVIWSSSLLAERDLGRARREAQVLARISHPHVVTVHSAGETDGSPYLVMEWVDGPSLDARLARDRPSPRQAARIVRDLAAAVAIVHGFGIIHRDIKPANVLLAGRAASDWERCIPKLADFGLARPMEVNQGITQDATALGTPASMAPEQTGLAEDLGAVGPAADVHGLGGLAFALVTGSLPYAAANPTASLHRAASGDVIVSRSFQRLPRDLKAIIEKCLERQPARRYATAEELADDLDRFLAGRPVQARRLSPPLRLQRAIIRKPLRALAIGLAGALAATMIGGFAWHSVSVARSDARAAQSEARAKAATAVATRSLDQLTGDLIEKMVLKSGPNEAGHLGFLRNIREEFSNWPLGDDPAAGMRFRLRGLRRVADLFFDVSQHDDALECHRRSLAVLDEFAAVRPDDPEVLRERLASMQFERSCLYQLGRNDEAEASARASIALVEAAPADMPGKELTRIEQVLDLGMFLHEQQRVDEGKENIDAALAGFRRLREARPEDVDLAAREAHALFCSQLSLFKAERFDDCRRHLEQLVGRSGGFLATHPADAMPRALRSLMTKMVGLGHAQLGRLAADQGRLDEAIDHVLRQRAICQAFVAELPEGEIDPVHKELIDAGLHAATLLDKAERHQEAAAAVERAEVTARFLHDIQPGVWDHAYLMGGLLWRQAEAARRDGGLEEAAVRYREIVTLLEPWKEAPACREKTELLIATAEAALADCLARQQDPPGRDHAALPPGR